ncbi:MAG: hypothetical protein K9K67_09725 [Bacteriovoracaceae bacterium]|nr:hypothetical protein [Bacteriovoracaceae bacterium]
MREAFIFLGMLLLCSTSYAGLFKIVNRTGTCVLACDSLETEVNSNLPSADQSNYLRGMANASVSSQKGLGASYGSNIDYLEVGFTGAIGADLGSNSTSDLIGGNVDYNQIRGIGVGGAVSLGLKGDLFGSSIGPLDMKRTAFYGYFMSLDAPTTDGLDGDSTSMGFHLRYKLIGGGGAGLGVFDWGGIDITTGIERAAMSIKFVKGITETVTSNGATASFNGTATVGADITTYTIPLEISTNFRLFYVASIFGGLGMDLSFGKAKSVASLTGDISVTGGGTGVASLDLGSEESPSLFAMRAFTGIQFNLTALKAFILLNKGIANDSLGLALGIRLAF